MTSSNHDRPPWAEAMTWVSRIMTVGLEMTVPGVLGHWLDQRWGTSFLALTGFAFGLAVGLWHLLRMTSQMESTQDAHHESDQDSPQ